MTYLVILVLLTMGAAFAAYSTNEGRIAERQKRIVKAFHIAEAGIERAIYDLREDYTSDPTAPGWYDGDINGIAFTPTTSYVTFPYSSTTMNGGSYSVEFRSGGANTEMWVRSTGTLGDQTQAILVYLDMKRISPWDNAIFAGAGAAGAMVNGNVDIRGSVHILGENLTSANYAIDLGGTAELVGNNYSGLASSLEAKVPALDQVLYNSELVETLHAELRVKNGLVGLSGSAVVGEVNLAGNSEKETVDAVYVTHGFGGSQGIANVHSDNGWSNAYDLGDAVEFPSLSDPSPQDPTKSVQEYIKSVAYIPTAVEEALLANITPASNFSIGNANGSISFDGAGNMTVNGVIYLDNGVSLNMNKTGSNKTITYTGNGSIFATGNIAVNTDLITSGNASFPNSIVGLMTPNAISMNEAGIDVMGLFYAETQVTVQKQTDVVGTIVSNYFDMGTNVPSIFQVPETANNLPPGMISGTPIYVMRIISWQKI